MGWTEDETFWVRIYTFYTFSPDRDLTLCSKRSFIHTRCHHGPKGSTYVLIYSATNCSSAELELAQNEEFIQCATEAAAQTTEPEWFSFNDPAIDYYSWSSQNCIPTSSSLQFYLIRFNIRWMISACFPLLSRVVQLSYIPTDSAKLNGTVVEKLVYWTPFTVGASPLNLILSYPGTRTRGIEPFQSSSTIPHPGSLWTHWNQTNLHTLIKGGKFQRIWAHLRIVEAR